MYRYHSGMEKGSKWTHSEDSVRRTSPISAFPQTIVIHSRRRPVGVGNGSQQRASQSRRAPCKGFQRDCHNNEKQEPSDHANNFRHYLLLAPSLVPDNDSLTGFCICHPDLNLENLKVLTDTSGLRIRSMLDSSCMSVCPTAYRRRRGLSKYA